MSTVHDLLRIAYLASLITLVLLAALVCYRTSVVVAALPESIQQEFERQANATRAAAVAELQTTRKQLIEELQKTRKELLLQTSQTSAAALSQLDRQASTLNSNLDRNLAGTVHQIETVSTDLQPVLHNAAEITGSLNQAAPLFLDCDHNADCVYNRYVGVARGMEQASIAVGQSAPATAKAVESTSKSVAEISSTYARKAPLYKRILEWSVPALVAWKLFK